MTFTPNIGLYIPAPGQTNFNDAFAQGMINLDQHDHTGGPNKGLPITSAGLADFSVTYNKLASNVVDPTTGIGVNSTPGLQNQLQILGILRNLFQLASVPGVGFVSMNGTTVAARTFQNSASVTWTNPDGVAGNPSATVSIAGISPVTVPNGGTGRTSLSPWDILCGGTTSTGNVQQVSGEGTAGQVLTSNGATSLPTWQDGIIVRKTVILTATQVQSLFTSGALVIPAPGAGKVICPISCYSKLNSSGTAFMDGSSVSLYYSVAGTFKTGIKFPAGCFLGTTNGYSVAAANLQFNISQQPSVNLENQPIYIYADTTDFTAGTGSTVSISVLYTIMQI